MLSNFSEVQAIVFFRPRNHAESIAKMFDVRPIQLNYSEIYVHVTDNPKAAKIVSGLSEEEFGHVMLWDGQNFVSENT